MSHFPMLQSSTLNSAPQAYPIFQALYLSKIDVVINDIIRSEWQV